MTGVHIQPVSRLAAVRDSVASTGVDGAIINDPDNRFYVSGFLVDDHGPTESAGVVLIGSEQPIVFTSPNNVEWAVSEASGFEVKGWTRPWETSVAAGIADLGWRKVGFEPASLSYASWSRLQAFDGDFELVPLSSEIDHLRWVKSDTEIALMQAAIDITDRAFERAEDLLEPGISERQLAAEIERFFHELGADCAAFPPTVGSGPNGARPHHRTGDRLIQDGETVVIDMGARVNGYCADLTRTCWVGELSAQARRIYWAVAEAQQAALATVRAGVPAKQVDQAARDVFEREGLSHYVVHAIGHGLGIRVHDGPPVNNASDLPLQTGNVITIEPGLYVPGLFGVRIEDVVVVEGEGCRILSHARKRSASDEFGKG
ncbi:aminopeptidase P family protein [soil metagenome]